MATENISIVVNSPPAATLTFTPASLDFVAPVAPNTVIGSIAIAPAGWEGVLVLSGPDEASFSLGTVSNETAELMSAVQLNAQAYNLVVSAAP